MDKKIKIAPSILAADFSKLGEEISAITIAGADYVHVDVMDGHYVPNLTIGPEVIKDIRKCTKIPFDVHLMITPVNPLLEDFAKSGSDIITFHPEAEDNPKVTIEIIKSLGCKVGISLNPSTEINVLDKIIEDIDLTPVVFWAVIAVTAVIAYEPNDVMVLMSAWIPAPPEESDPAIINIFDFGFNFSK